MTTSNREALSQLFLEMLEAEGETRLAAEQKINALKTMKQYGQWLVEIVLDSNCKLAVRELAVTNLKTYIEIHWDSSADSFRGPNIMLRYKNTIKELLPVGLQDSNNEIRAAVAELISMIAKWDWPEYWPQLFDALVDCLNKDNELLVQAVLSILTKLTNDDLTVPQIQYGSSVILRETYRIFERKDQYSVQTRREVVNIFTKIVSTVTSTGILDLIQQHLEPLLPKFCEKFIETLKTENDVNNNNDLKMHIVKATQILMAKIPKCISDYLPQILPLIWETFMDISRVHQKSTVNGAHDVYKLIDIDVVATVEFFAQLMAGPDAYELNIPDYNLSDNHWFYLLDNYIPPEALHHLINLLQITDKQIKVWEDNINVFIEDEELKGSCLSDHTIRRGVEDLLIAIINRPERVAANSLLVVILKELEAEIAIRENKDRRESKNWWKSHEAFLVAFGLAKDMIIQKQKTETLRFDVVNFFQNVILKDLTNPESHLLLVGRCLCLGGIYADQLPPETIARFLETTVTILRENDLSLTKVCAIKASGCWYNRDNFDSGNNRMQEIRKSHLPALYLELDNLGCQLLSWEISVLVLRSVANLISFDKEFTYSMENKISPLTIDAFHEFHTQYLVRLASGRIFKELTLNPECRVTFQNRLVQILIPMMTDRENNNKEGACTALEILVKHSPKPLIRLLIEKAFPACCKCPLEVCSSDYGTLNSAAKVIRSYLLVDPEQVIGYRDESGKTGPQYIIEAVTRLLNSNFRCVFISVTCEILISLIKETGYTLQQNMEPLLTALLMMMQGTNSKSAPRHKLLMVFAYLINAQFDMVYDFLAKNKAGSQSALAFVLADGFCKEYKFLPRNDGLRTVTLALSRVLEHGVVRCSSELHKIEFRSEQVISVKHNHGKVDNILTGGAATPLLGYISRIISNHLFYCKEVKSSGTED